MHPENISRQSRECPLCLCKYPESTEIWKDIQCKYNWKDIKSNLWTGNVFRMRKRYWLCQKICYKVGIFYFNITQQQEISKLEEYLHEIWKESHRISNVSSSSCNTERKDLIVNKTPISNSGTVNRKYFFSVILNMKLDPLNQLFFRYFMYKIWHKAKHLVTRQGFMSRFNG